MVLCRMQLIIREWLVKLSFRLVHALVIAYDVIIDLCHNLDAGSANFC